MKRVIFKAIMPCVVLGFAAVFSGCVMQLDNIAQDKQDSVRSVVSLMNRSDAEKMLYMGGSVLYSPKDSNANQLMEGATVATRIGKVEKIDLGNGQYAYRNSKIDYELGFIVVDAISKEEISFTYYKFPSADSNRYISSGSFTLREGQTADLNGDGRVIRAICGLPSCATLMLEIPLQCSLSFLCSMKEVLILMVCLELILTVSML